MHFLLYALAPGLGFSTRDLDPGMPPIRTGDSE
jgi:hypothetical protein